MGNAHRSGTSSKPGPLPRLHSSSSARRCSARRWSCRPSPPGGARHDAEREHVPRHCERMMNRPPRLLHHAGRSRPRATPCAAQRSTTARARRCARRRVAEGSPSSRQSRGPSSTSSRSMVLCPPRATAVTTLRVDAAAPQRLDHRPRLSSRVGSTSTDGHRIARRPGSGRSGGSAEGRAHYLLPQDAKLSSATRFRFTLTTAPPDNLIWLGRYADRCELTVPSSRLQSRPRRVSNPDLPLLAPNTHYLESNRRRRRPSAAHCPSAQKRKNSAGHSAGQNPRPLLARGWLALRLRKTSRNFRRLRVQPGDERPHSPYGLRRNSARRLFFLPARARKYVPGSVAGGASSKRRPPPQAGALQIAGTNHPLADPKEAPDGVDRLPRSRQAYDYTHTPPLQRPRRVEFRHSTCWCSRLNSPASGAGSMGRAQGADRKAS